MVKSEPENDQTPQEILRSVIELCADCDTCRFLMDEDCAFFPELYRLWDQEKEDGQPISEEQLRHLSDLCTLCGLCPCPRIPIDVMKAKSRYVEGEGLPLANRLLTDVPRLARLCGTFPRLVNALQSSRTVVRGIGRVGVFPPRVGLELARNDRVSKSLKNRVVFSEGTHAYPICCFQQFLAGTGTLRGRCSGTGDILKTETHQRMNLPAQAIA